MTDIELNMSIVYGVIFLLLLIGIIVGYMIYDHHQEQKKIRTQNCLTHKQDMFKNCPSGVLSECLEKCARAT